MTDNTSGIRLTGVSKAFGSRPVLTGLHLELEKGSVTAILGPSGCGKSTLLRIVAGFEVADTGTVHIGGDLMSEGPFSLAAHRRRVGLMPQEGALFPHLSVAGNVAFGLGRMRRAETASVVAHWLALVGLDGAAEARPHELSGGQQQRVALARALAAKPRVLLLDEPFAALDAGLRVRVREDIIDILRASGTTAIVVTHDQAEALSLADSVAVLLDGSVGQHSDPRALYHRPVSLSMARFVGSTVEVTGTYRDGLVHTALGIHPTRNVTATGTVTVVIRPEQIEIATTDRPGAVAGTVTGHRFYGPEAVVRVALADDTSLELRHAGGCNALEVGDAVLVRVDGDVLVY